MALISMGHNLPIVTVDSLMHNILRRASGFFGLFQAGCKILGASCSFVDLIFVLGADIAFDLFIFMRIEARENLLLVDEFIIDR